VPELNWAGFYLARGPIRRARMVSPSSAVAAPLDDNPMPPFQTCRQTP